MCIYPHVYTHVCPHTCTPCVCTRLSTHTRGTGLLRLRRTQYMQVFKDEGPGHCIHLDKPCLKPRRCGQGPDLSPAGAPAPLPWRPPGRPLGKAGAEASDFRATGSLHTPGRSHCCLDRSQTRRKQRQRGSTAHYGPVKGPAPGCPQTQYRTPNFTWMQLWSLPSCRVPHSPASALLLALGGSSLHPSPPSAGPEGSMQG